MSVPASYDQHEITYYMHSTLGKTAEALGWAPPNSYEEAVTDTLLLYGVDDIASATDIEKLRACARLAAWQAVEADTAGYFQFSTDGQSFHREQIHQQATAMVKRERVKAMRYGVGLTVSSTPVTHAHDPFVYSESEG